MFQYTFVRLSSLAVHFGHSIREGGKNVQSATKMSKSECRGVELRRHHTDETHEKVVKLLATTCSDLLYHLQEKDNGACDVLKCSAKNTYKIKPN